MLAELAELRRQEAAATQERAALAARVEALAVGPAAQGRRRRAAGRRLAGSGLLGSLSRPGRGRARPTRRPSRPRSAPRPTPSPSRASTPRFAAVDHLKAEDLGRAGLLLARERRPTSACRGPWRRPAARRPVRRRRRRTRPTTLRPALTAVLRQVAVVDDLDAARAPGRRAARADRGHPRRRRLLRRHLPSRRLQRAAEPDRGCRPPSTTPSDRLAEASHTLRPAAVRAEPASRRSTATRPRGRRGDAGPAARVRRGDVGAGRGARPAQRTSRSAVARRPRGWATRSARPRRPGTATPPGSPSWSSGWRWPPAATGDEETDPADARRAGRAGPHGALAAPRWTRGSPCAPMEERVRALSGRADDAAPRRRARTRRPGPGARPPRAAAA